MDRPSAIRKHLNNLVQKVRRLRMGGANQGKSSPLSVSSGKSHSGGKTPDPVRFHEVTSRGEVDFHDDRAGLKCAVDSATFFSAYSGWRSKMTDEMTLTGNDGSGGHSSVTFLPHVDDAGELQVSMIVAKTKVGQSVSDLDRLAHYS